MVYCSNTGYKLTCGCLRAVSCLSSEEKIRFVKPIENSVSKVEDNYHDKNVSLEESWLWTGESVYCKCTHHVTEHCTHCYQNKQIFHCHKCKECEGFEAYKTRLGTSVETEPLRLKHSIRIL